MIFYKVNSFYNIPQGNATYDAATANMGYPWKMFTKDQGQELIDNTTSVWTTINGVNGRKFINKSDSNKYIFLPAGGWWSDKYGLSSTDAAHLWSSTHSNPPYAYCYSASKIATISGIENRQFGCSIRPIRHLN